MEAGRLLLASRGVPLSAESLAGASLEAEFFLVMTAAHSAPRK